MASDEEILGKFWKALESERTAMLGLAGADDYQPMTAVIEDEDDAGGPVWFFTSKDTDLAKNLGDAGDAAIQFASKGHDIFATMRGRLLVDNDRAVIDRLWSPFIAAWYEGGKSDPKPLLLRFEPRHAHIWLNENSMFAGVKMLLGKDPKKDYKDKVADVRLQ